MTIPRRALDAGSRGMAAQQLTRLEAEHSAVSHSKAYLEAQVAELARRIEAQARLLQSIEGQQERLRELLEGERG